MKNIKIKPMLCLILILIVGGTFIGCAPKGDPSEVLNKYYDNVKNSRFDANYEYLSNDNKSDWTKENFKECLSIQSETESVKDVKIEKTNEYKNKDLDGINYKNVVEFNVTEMLHDNLEDKDENLNYVRYVVNENDVWKVHRDKEDSKERISMAKCDLASMYYYGKGKNKDLNQATIILKKSIEENPNFKNSYYMLGVIYNDLQRYDEAIEMELKYLDKETDDKLKSNGYNVLGSANVYKRNYSKAKEYYNQAIQLNPDNEYAKTNLENVNKLIN